MSETVKKTRKKRAITIEEGVKGTELSLYVKDMKVPEIILTFLHKEKYIYKDYIKIYFRDDIIEDFDVLNYCNLLYMQLATMGIKKESEVYQTISMLFGVNTIRDFGIRHLIQNAYFQATYGFKGYTKYNNVIRDEFFIKPLKEKRGI